MCSFIFDSATAMLYLLSHFRDRWPGSVTGRPPVASPGRTDEDDDDDEGDDIDEVEGLERDEDHVYQSLERQSRADDINVVYAVPLKQKKVKLCVFGAYVQCFVVM